MSDTEAFPTRPEQLSPELLTQYLRASGHLDSGRVTGLESSIIGTGKMGDNARLKLRYEGDTGRAPLALVAKFPAADEHARSMAGAQGAYYNEVMFYRRFAGRTQMRTPEIFASELSEDRASFLLLMEDMSPAEPGSQLIGESRERSALALAEAAKLAVAFYGDESIGEYDHVMSPGRDDGAVFGQALMEQSWPGFVDRFGADLSAECIAFGEYFCPRYAHFVNRLQAPKALVHGDFRSENILFDGEQATVVDWQTPALSSVVTDAAYFLGGSVAIDDRRDWERELIADYRQQLVEDGVDISLQDCWEQYREYAMHGLLITVLGAAFSTPDPRGDKMFLAMIQGHLQQCLDLDSREFLS